jgi:membrane protein
MQALRWFSRVAVSAFVRFHADDGWAIASHIALSSLMALFPFLRVRPGTSSGIA